MTAVLDASAAVGLAVNPADLPAAQQAIGRADFVIAPELVAAEVANAFWKYLRPKQLTREQCERGLKRALSIVDEYAPLEPLSVEAFELAAALGRPVYDAYYLVLARRNGAVLITADVSMKRAAEALGVRTSGRG